MARGPENKARGQKNKVARGQKNKAARGQKNKVARGQKNKEGSKKQGAPSKLWENGFAVFGRFN